MTECEMEIVLKQLAEGNAGAQAYFIARVDIFLRQMQPPDGSAPLSPHLSLAGFMQTAWPAFAKGIRLRNAERFAARFAPAETANKER